MEAFEIIAYILCSLSPFAAFEIIKVLTEIRERVVNIETKVDAFSFMGEAAQEKVDEVGVMGRSM